MNKVATRKTCKRLDDGAKLCEENQLPGDRGIYQTMYKMRDLIRRDARDERIIKEARKHIGATDLETVQNIWKFVVKNYPYMRDPEDREFVNAPIHVLSEEYLDEYPYRDCDDLTVLFACLLKAAGIRDQYIKALAWRKHDYTHIYNWVRIPSLGGYLPIDIVMKKDGFGNQKSPERRAIYLKV